MPKPDELNVRIDVASFEVFPWNKNFETGYDTIDEQHKILVGLLNELAKTLIGEGEIKVNKAFEALADYATLHFHSEEAVWLEYFGGNDAWFSAHKRVHDSFLPEVIKIKEKDAGKSLYDAVESIVKFLIHWLAFHIIDIDKRMSLAVGAIKSGASIDKAKLLADEKMSGAMRVLTESVLDMYEKLSAKTIALMRERQARVKAEKELQEANMALLADISERVRLEEELKKLATTDKLTQAYNRTKFDEIITNELKRVERYHKMLSILMLDIDNFKAVNDTHGHIVGDSVLRALAGILRSNKRDIDHLVRWGGEEFMIVAPETDIEGAKILAERLRTAIEDHQFDTAGRITVSLGVAQFRQDDSEDSFIKRADDALYKAKTTGRNKLVIGA